MTLPPATDFVFVDFENVPEVDLSLISGQPVHVSLLIGRNQKKIDLELVEQIQQFASQVKLVKVGGSGHNALDLTLACYLGRAIERSPSARFAIVSKDKDFTPMIIHLVDHNVKVARYDTFSELPFLPRGKGAVSPKSGDNVKSVASARKSTEDRGSKVIARLKHPGNRNRPSDETALRAYIKTGLGKEATDAKVSDMVRDLQSAGVVAIDGKGKVSYHPTAPKTS